MFDLKNKVALITGSSRGIGRAIAEGLATAGANVVISSRNQDACNEVAAEINETHGNRVAIAKAASLSSKESLEDLVAYTVSELGRVDCLVCNAATNPFYGPMSKISDDAFRKVFENNVLANHWLTNLAAPEMKKQGGGSIILISSVGAYIGSDTIGAYHISKAADLQMVRNLAVEYGADNIRVNAISPGVTRTEFARALWENPVAEEALNRATPLGRIGEPSEMAGAAVFLASPAASYITGQAIVIDGGMTIAGPG